MEMTRKDAAGQLAIQNQEVYPNLDEVDIWWAPIDREE